MAKSDGHATTISKTECQFAAVNGVHCQVSSGCMFCPMAIPADEPRLEKGQQIELRNFGPLDGMYKIANIRDNKLKLEFVK